MSTAGVIIIGNEILSGKVEEANARFMIGQLRELGVTLHRIAFIRDEIETIGREVAFMSQAYDHVFTSGGVGSTHDDVTFEGVARGLGVPVVLEPQLEAILQKHFQERMNDAVLRMCMVPEGTELLYGEDTHYPVVSVSNVYVLPGVPEFLRNKFEILKERLRGAPFHLRQLYLSLGEDAIAETLAATQSAYEDLELGSYPRFDTDEYKVRVTIEGRDQSRVNEAFEHLLGRFDAATIVRSE